MRVQLPSPPTEGHPAALCVLTLPARVTLWVLQGLGSSKGYALEDVHGVTTQEAESLVDTFHKSSFCVHDAQLWGDMAGSGSRVLGSLNPEW